MNNSERFSYTAVSSQPGEAGLLPQLPLTLTYQNRSVESLGLLDTGATVNVLPYAIGLQLGALWETQAPAIVLTGNLARYEARPIVIFAAIGNFASVQLAFAWTQASDIP